VQSAAPGRISKVASHQHYVVLTPPSGIKIHLTSGGRRHPALAGSTPAGAGHL